MKFYRGGIETSFLDELEVDFCKQTSNFYGENAQYGTKVVPNNPFCRSSNNLHNYSKNSSSWLQGLARYNNDLNEIKLHNFASRNKLFISYTSTTYN